MSADPNTPIDPSTFLPNEIREHLRRFVAGVEALGGVCSDVMIHTKQEFLRGQKVYIKANREHTIMFPNCRGDGDGITLFGKPCDEGVYQNLPTLRED